MKSGLAQDTAALALAASLADPGSEEGLSRLEVIVVG